MAQTINADNGVISGSTGLKFTADTTGILDLQTNGTTKVTIDSSGNLVVGTFTTSIAKKFTVVGEGNFSDTSNNTRLYMGFGTIPGTGSSGSYIYNADNSPLAFGTTNTERMRIDALGRAIFSGLIYHSSSTAVAAAGTTQGTATALTAQINNVTTGIDGTAGVILPTPAQAGLRIFIRNGSASLSLNIYPHSGGNIAGTGVNAAISIEFATVLEFIAFDTTNWYLPSAVLS
jgi:hypothetical protein